MTQMPPFGPEPPRPPRRVFPVPIILPGCCGCGFISLALIAVTTLGGGLVLHDPAPHAAATGTAVVRGHTAP